MHRRQHEDWCAELAYGDTELVPPALLREMRTCAECAGAIEQLRGVQTGLSRIAADDREVVAAALALPSAPGESQIESRLRALAAPRSPSTSDSAPRRAPTRRWRVLALAAGLALLVGGAWVFSRSSPSEPERPQVLGAEGEFSAMHPSAPGDDPARWSWLWSEPLPDGGSYRVTVRALDDSGAADIEKKYLRRPEWIPTADELRRLPSRFAWTVQVCDIEGIAQATSQTVEFSLAK